MPPHAFIRFLAAGMALCAAGWVFLAKALGSRPRDTRAAIDPREPAADPQAGPVPVRSAGPAAMRDGDGLEWDKVDQAVDESFPASDPPSR
jgi:hypothetical protein